MAKLSEGDTAPNFCLEDENGDEHCLEKYKGQWVVVYFYPKDNTPGCTQEAKDFSCMAGDFGSLNTVVLGISSDSLESHKKFRLKHELDVILLSDPDHKALEKYGAWGEKKMYGKLFMGTTRSTYLVDPEGKIVRAWPKVKVKGHVEEVLDAIKENR